MNILLTSDWHLTDSPLEEYRWLFLEKQLPDLVREHKIAEVWCLGDAADRKDRHSGFLINRLVKVLTYLECLGCKVCILMGNHDGPVTTTQPYWEFLNDIGVTYITKPLVISITNVKNEVIMLPFSANPREEWKNLKLGSYKAIFMHQTLAGALIEGDRKIQEDSNPMPILPRGVPIYSGDVHRPQQFGSILYVGCPFPTRFGEVWGGRVLIVSSDDWGSYTEIKLDCINRLIIDLYDQVDFNLESKWKNGDQVRVRVHLSASRLNHWPETEAKIKEAAKVSGVQLLSTESILSEEITSDGKEIANITVESLSPVETLRLFCEEEKIPSELLSVGLELLRNAIIQ